MQRAPWAASSPWPFVRRVREVGRWGRVAPVSRPRPDKRVEPAPPSCPPLRRRVSSGARAWSGCAGPLPLHSRKTNMMVVSAQCCPRCGGRGSYRDEERIVRCLQCSRPLTPRPWEPPKADASQKVSKRRLE